VRLTSADVSLGPGRCCWNGDGCIGCQVSWRQVSPTERSTPDARDFAHLRRAAWGLTAYPAGPGRGHRGPHGGAERDPRKPITVYGTGATPELKRRGLAEIHRVLKPAGRLVAVDFGATPRDGIGHLLCVLRLRTGWDHAERLRQMVREVGFEAVEMGPTGHRALAFVRGRKPSAAEG
jgi:hypothetical protein